MLHSTLKRNHRSIICFPSILEGKQINVTAEHFEKDEVPMPEIRLPDSNATFNIGEQREKQSLPSCLTKSEWK
jgi:hypothetical protein